MTGTYTATKNLAYGDNILHDTRGELIGQVMDVTRVGGSYVITLVVKGGSEYRELHPCKGNLRWRTA
jgi:hypothetical protein